MSLVMFSKMLQEFAIPELARRIHEMGFDGIDLTVRRGGHIEPAEVGVKLPEAIKAIRDAGLTLPMITTEITSATDPHAEAIVMAAVHENVRLLKLGYWSTSKGHLIEAIDKMRKDLDALERLAAQYHVTFGIHNHSGPGYVNCQPAVIWTLLKDRDPNHIGAYFDPGHATVEGGDGGWRQALELLGPSLRMIAVKDFDWKATPGKQKVVWKSRQVPLKDGIVPWPEVFDFLAAAKFTGPISLHSEYKGGHSWRDLNTAELIAQTKEDLAFVKKLMK